MKRLSPFLLGPLSLSLLFLIGCSLAPKPAEKVKTKDDQVVIMTYNVENLFDAKDDPDKKDEEYLPRAVKSSPHYQSICYQMTNPYYQKECLYKDWTETLYKRKISRLADVISQVNQGHGPDILVLDEVENIGALKDLAAAMPSLNYKTVELIEGPDERGIDVGLISRLPMKEAKLHDAGIKDFKTRGILEVELILPDGKPLYVLGVHLPSQAAPTSARRTVFKTLAKVKKSLPKDALVYASGDFNVAAREEAKEKLFRHDAQEDWAVSHLIGCKTCQGTYYYHSKREWSFFDAFLFDKRMTNGKAAWQVDPDSIHIFNDNIYQVNRWGSPARFGSGMKGVGVSDHWPLVATLVKGQTVVKNQKGETP